MSMMTDTDTDTDIDTEDLDAADRGNDLPAADDPLRDEQGRFAAKDEMPKDEAAETDADDDEEDEDADADADDDSGKPDNKNYAVRYHKARGKLEKAEERLRELESQLQQRAAADPPAAAKYEAPRDPVAEIEAQLDGLYEQVEDARADGDTKLAASLQRHIDRGNVQIAEIKASRIAQATAANTSESSRFNALLDVAEAMIGAVNPESPDYSAAKVEALEAMVVGYERQGLAPSAALAKAVNAMFDVDLLAKPKKGAAPSAAEPPAKKPEPKKPDAKKAVETAAKQPPSTDGMGVNKDDSKLRIADLSDDEFEKLPEATKARYRGDSLAA